MSKTAREVITEAVRLATNEVTWLTPEILLSSILTLPDSSAVASLRQVGVTPDRVVEELKFRAANPKASAETVGTLNPRTTRVLELAYDYANDTGQAEVNSEHLLIGILREADSIAAIALAKLGLRLPKTLPHLKAAASSHAQTEPSVYPRPKPKAKPPATRKILPHEFALFVSFVIDIAFGIQSGNSGSTKFTYLFFLDQFLSADQIIGIKVWVMVGCIFTLMRVDQKHLPLSKRLAAGAILLIWLLIALHFWASRI